MSQTPTISGLGRGRARGRRDLVEGESLAERRPGWSRVDDWESELAGSQSDMESNWKSRTDSASEPVIGYRLTIVVQATTTAYELAVFKAMPWLYAYDLCLKCVCVGVLNIIQQKMTGIKHIWLIQELTTQNISLLRHMEHCVISIFKRVIQLGYSVDIRLHLGYEDYRTNTWTLNNTETNIKSLKQNTIKRNTDDFC